MEKGPALAACHCSVMTGSLSPPLDELMVPTCIWSFAKPRPLSLTDEASQSHGARDPGILRFLPLFREGTAEGGDSEDTGGV